VIANGILDTGSNTYSFCAASFAAMGRLMPRFCKSPKAARFVVASMEGTVNFFNCTCLKFSEAFYRILFN